MVKVKVEQGWLEGEHLETSTGDGKYYSFKGIPYAAPPIGTLRFKAPQPPTPWEGVRKATEHGAKCWQQDIFTNTFVPGSEDCLYLNVYSPEINPKKPLPVMFFIHGGGYKSGSGNVENYGPDLLMSHDVVLVTINYRLEVLGFLCLDIKEVPGNAGMKDQVAALRWVNKNIANFGGDPNNITVFGESAGGASTALHMTSPMSKGLFKRAIPMSGVPISDFSVEFEPVRRACTLGKQLGIDTEDRVKLLEFLQNVPAEKLVHTNPCIISSEEVSNNIFKMYHFVPVVEKDFGVDRFLTEDPEELLRKGKVHDVDVLIGYTDQEALVGVSIIESVMDTYNKYPELYAPRKILISSSPKKILQAAELIRRHYLGNKPMCWDTMKEAVTYMSDSCFTYDVAKYISLLAANGNNKIYQYIFSCFSERNIYGSLGAKSGITGASHLDDLMYLFDAKKVQLPLEKNSKSYKMVQQTCALFTNFAKYGNPTPDSSLGVVWPPYDNVDKFYLDIGETLKTGKELNAEHIVFWKKVYEIAGDNN